MVEPLPLSPKTSERYASQRVSVMYIAEARRGD
jgi:hypothetical protein